MKNRWHHVRALYFEEDGQDLIEYALIAAMIGLVAVASMTKLSQSINDYVWQKVVTPFEGV